MVMSCPVLSRGAVLSGAVVSFSPSKPFLLACWGDPKSVGCDKWWLVMHEATGGLSATITSTRKICVQGKPLSRMYLQLCAGCTADHSGSFYCLNLFALKNELSQDINFHFQRLHFQRLPSTCLVLLYTWISLKNARSTGRCR